MKEEVTLHNVLKRSEVTPHLIAFDFGDSFEPSDEEAIITNRN